MTIVKPDAFGSGKTGNILAHLEAEGFQLVAARVIHLRKSQAEEFYTIHKDRPFFDSLVGFMTSGRCMPMLLKRDDAVAHLRLVIGATDPAEADAGTVRALYAESKERNAIHASDSDANARIETAFFFEGTELL
ncbi:MAG: nucleoside-diphosphate kinase [Gemmatimonadota bacterium]